MKFHKTILNNGLTIIAEEMPSARSMALGFFTRTGSRDEWPEVAGVSHFLEHMMFKGTHKRSALEVNLEFDRMGAKYNAFTSEENTVFYAAILPEYQNQIIELWADLLRPALRDDDFNMEKNVILEEIAMYKDMPHFDVMDRCRQLHFGNHSCGNSVLGTDESITALTADQMRDYFHRRYAPDNMVLAACGKIDWDRLVEQAHRFCGHWEPTNPQRSLSHFSGTGQIRMESRANIVRQHLCLINAGPSSQDDLRRAALILSNIIGDTANSRLYWALVDNAMADSADMDYDAMDGTGAFFTYISCDPQNTEKVLDTVRSVYTKLMQDGIRDNELIANKNKIASALTLHGELPMGRLVPLGFDWTYRHENIPLAEELLLLEKVSRDDVMTVLEQYQMASFTIQGLGPELS